MEQSINIIEMLFDYGMKLCRSKKHLLIQDFKKMIEQKFGKDDFLEKYIYPVWCGIAKFSSKNTANYKNDLFIQALQIVIEEIYVRNHLSIPRYQGQSIF